MIQAPGTPKSQQTQIFKEHLTFFKNCCLNLLTKVLGQFKSKLQHVVTHCLIRSSSTTINLWLLETSNEIKQFKPQTFHRITQQFMICSTISDRFPSTFKTVEVTKIKNFFCWNSEEFLFLFSLRKKVANRVSNFFLEMQFSTERFELS